VEITSGEMFRIKGANNTLIVYEDRVLLTKEGLLQKYRGGMGGDRTIYYRDMMSIEYKKPKIDNGYIKFIMPGSVDATARSGFGTSSAQTWAANLDPNNVILASGFSKAIGENADKCYSIIMEQFNKAKSAVNSPITVQASTSADELAKFKKLLDDGVITQDEFEVKKKQLLNL